MQKVDQSPNTENTISQRRIGRSHRRCIPTSHDNRQPSERGTMGSLGISTDGCTGPYHRRGCRGCCLWYVDDRGSPAYGVRARQGAWSSMYYRAMPIAQCCTGIVYVDYHVACNARTRFFSDSPPRTMPAMHMLYVHFDFAEPCSRAAWRQ